MAKDREILATIGPSQWLNIGWFILPFVHVYYLGWSWYLLISVGLYYYKYLEIKTWKYILYADRIVERKGVFDVTETEMQYFRIKSLMSVEPLWFRFLGLSIINIKSSESYKPVFVLHAVKNKNAIEKFLRTAARDWRNKMGVREHDINNIY